MTDPPEDNFIVCMPYEGTLRNRVPGAKIYQCNDCGKDVTAAPSSQIVINTKGFKTICLSCVIKRMKVECPEKIKLVPGAIPEIIEALSKGKGPTYAG